MTDTLNHHLVAAKGDAIGVLNPPTHWMTRGEALLFAAWLVAVTGDREEFLRILAAVENT